MFSLDYAQRYSILDFDQCKRSFLFSTLIHYKEVS